MADTGGRHILSGNVAFAVERNRRRSVPDIQNGTHGDAAACPMGVEIHSSPSFIYSKSSSAS